MQDQYSPLAEYLCRLAGIDTKRTRRVVLDFKALEPPVIFFERAVDPVEFIPPVVPCVAVDATGNFPEPNLLKKAD